MVAWLPAHVTRVDPAIAFLLLRLRTESFLHPRLPCDLLPQCICGELHSPIGHSHGRMNPDLKLI